MNTFNNNIFKVGSARQIAICSVLAIAVAMPVTSFAAGGYWAQNRGITKVRAKVQQVKSNTVKKVAKAPAKAKERIENLAEQVEEMVAQIRENQPLLNHIKDGPVMSGVIGTMEFLQERQAEFQQFISQDADYFKDDMKNLLGDFIAIGDEFSIARQRKPVIKGMKRLITLIDKLPPALLYPMYQAVGPRLDEMQMTVSSIRTKLEAIPDLPSVPKLIQDPYKYADTICPLVTDKKTEVHVATLLATLKYANWIVKSIKKATPQDFTVSATVVGGGGLTLMVHPARVPLITLESIIEAIEININTSISIGKSVCVVTGDYDPNA